MPTTLRSLLDEIARQDLKAHVLARKAGLAVSTVQHIMNGNGTPSIDTVERIAKVLGLRLRLEKL